MYLMQEPAEAVKAKDEYDVVMMTEVKCKPPGFTKWDTTVIEVLTITTLGEFLDLFKRQTELNCDLLFHGIAELGGEVSGLMLYDRNAFGKAKQVYADHMDTPLCEWIYERYQGLVDCSRRHVELQTSCSDDDDVMYKIPTVICKFVSQ
jgi:hypothetical protein